MHLFEPILLWKHNRCAYKSLLLSPTSAKSALGFQMEYGEVPLVLITGRLRRLSKNESNQGVWQLEASLATLT
jgi:hypothetical protein